MQVSDHSLRQIDEAYLERLEEAALRSLSSKLLLDLKEARERLNQTSRNSSLPPSREAPWERPPRAEAALEPDEDPEAIGTVAEEMPGEAPTDTSAAASEPAPAGGPSTDGPQTGGEGEGRARAWAPRAGAGGWGGIASTGAVRGMRSQFGGADRPGLHGL